MSGKMSRGVGLLALAAGVYAKIQFGSEKTSELANEVASFMVIGDWGGSPSAPYTTPGQLAAAASMAKVAVEQLATFVVSPGGNFYGGLQGARLDAASRGRVPARVRAPFTRGAHWVDQRVVVECTWRKDARPVAWVARGVAPQCWATGSNWTQLPGPLRKDGQRQSHALSALTASVSHTQRRAVRRPGD